MITEKETCPNCGKTSCNKNCSTNPNSTDNFKPLVPSCKLSNQEMAERKELLQATMAEKIAKIEELETGYDLIFHEPVEYSKELLEFINFERECCASFSFALIFEPNNKATHLQMYGSKEIKEEIKNGFIELGFLKQPTKSDMKSKRKKSYKTMGWIGIGACGLLCILSLLVTAVGIGAFTALGYYFERMSIVVLGITGVLFAFHFYQKRTSQRDDGASCKGDCGCNPELSTNTKT